MNWDALQYGSVGEWVGGVAAALGLFFAGIEIRRARQEREQEEKRRVDDEIERRKAMARAVGVNAEYPDVTVEEIAATHPWAVEESEGDPHLKDDRYVWYGVEYQVTNGGDYPIDNVLLAIRDPGKPPHDDPQITTAAEEVIGTVAGGQTVSGRRVVHFTDHPVFGELTSLAAVLFTDTWNTHWYRASGELVERDQPPRIC